ncbi:MAG TPA: 50S ribosomal protein L6 [Candidatus Paceibacterota bacterium]|nr:50S ribosomal protein L6 [Candidatus Paceibacterota bacterium]
MSRLARKPIAIPSKVTVSTDGGVLSVKGPAATLERPIHPAVSLSVTPEGVTVAPADDTKLARALTGTFAAHTRAMISGVETPFKRVLVMKGVGFKVELKGRDLVFNVGFSHPVTLSIPEGLEAKVEKLTITVEGADKQKVGQFAAEIRAIKPPEPYLGKGIAYDNEVIRRKQGKKAV